MKRRGVLWLILLGITGLGIFGFLLSGREEAPHGGAPDASTGVSGLPSAEPGGWPEISLTIRKQTTTPILDPGHGGGDGGATSVTGVLESGLNLDIALKTELLMRFLGFVPVMTRETDISIHDPDKKTLYDQKQSDIRNRVKLVNQTPNGVLISIHQNLFEQSQYSGAQVFHNGDPLNKAFAEAAQDLLRSKLDPGNNRLPQKADFYLLKYAEKPAILVECGFLSNPEEEALLRAPLYQRKLAMTLTAVFFQTALCRCEPCLCEDCRGFCAIPRQ